MERGVDAATAAAWAAVGGDAALAAGVSFRGAGGVLPAVLPVRELARASVGACSLAAAELWAVRSGGGVPGVRVDEGAVAAAFVSERHLRVEGRSGSSFAPLSGFWEAADGWVRTHANYPHHRARLLEALGVGGSGADDGGAGAVESGGGGCPGVLPAQALDHGTGYLLAAGVLRALSDREGDGRGREVRLSLAGTARWLLGGVGGVPAGEGVFEPGAWMAGRVTPYGRVRYVLSPLGVVGGPVDWVRGPGVWGGDRAVWV